MSIGQFVQELTASLEAGVPLIGCSRVDIYIPEEYGKVVLLPRTQPDLSEAMLSGASLQYPIPLLVNTAILLSASSNYMSAGTVLPSSSELSCAVMTGVLEGNTQGTILDKEAMIFYVPLLDFSGGGSERAQQWAAAFVSDLEHSFNHERDTDVIELFIVHFPDVLVQTLTDEQLQQVVKIAIGWNYALHLDDDYFQGAMDIIKNAAEHARPLITYNPQ